MIAWALLDATGVFPISCGLAADLPVGAEALPAGLMPAVAATMMKRDGIWQPRPQIPGPVTIADPSVRLALAFEGLPTGASAQVSDVEIGAHIATVPADAEGRIALRFADAGEYQIEVSAPLPWLGWSGRVSC